MKRIGDNTELLRCEGVVTDQVRKCLHKYYVGRFPPRKKAAVSAKIFRISLAFTTRQFSDFIGLIRKGFLLSFGASIFPWQWCERWPDVFADHGDAYAGNLFSSAEVSEVCSGSQGGWVDSVLSFYHLSRLHGLALMLKHCRWQNGWAWALLWSQSSEMRTPGPSWEAQLELCFVPHFSLFINKVKNQGFQGRRSPKFLFSILLTRWQVNSDSSFTKPEKLY